MGKQYSVTVIGRYDSKTGIGQHSKAFLKTLEGKIPLNYLNTRPTSKSSSNFFPSISPSINEIEKKDLLKIKKNHHISVFTDVLCNSSLDKDYKLSNFANIKVALVAFESDKIPPSWVKIINKNFDLIIVYGLFLKDAFKNSGVEKDIIYLPLALDYSDLGEISSKKNNDKSAIKYGFIGSYEKRKNVELLVDSFNAAFKGTNVELHIHLSYNFCYDLSKFNMFLNRIMSNQIKVTSGHLDRKDYIRLIKSIDCFISLSMGEGFSIIPREFMYLEKPIILSHSAAHKDIPNLDGIFHIPATIPFPAHYPQIDKKYYGLQYSPYIDDIVNLWSKIHEEIKKRKVYPELKGYAKSFSIESLAKKYEQIFNPQKIALGNTSCVEDDCLKITSKNLLNKYKEIIPDLKIEKIKNISKHVVLAHDGGFFSVFNRFISILAWETKDSPSNIVIPDWRVKAIKDFLGHDNFKSFCYGKESDGNIFLKLFEPLPYNETPEEYYNDDRWLSSDSILRTDFNEKKEPNLTNFHAYKLYKSPDFSSWRQWYHSCFKKYIKLRSELQFKVDDFYNKNLKDSFVIGAHIRHTSHIIEQPGLKMPTLDTFKGHIEKQLNLAKKSQSKPVKIFIATDQDSVITYFSKYFSDILVTTQDSTRTSEVQDKHFETIPEKQQKKEGYQIIHLMAANKNLWSTKMAEEIILDTYILSKSNIFIHITSNIATAVSYMNPNCKMIYCEE